VYIVFAVLQVLKTILVAVAMALALAHALELPGKMRLDDRDVTHLRYRVRRPGGAA
jgi:hypothetical protein